MKPWPKDLRDLTFVSLDTETTGLSPRYCELVEVAAVRFRLGGEEMGRFDQLIDPGCRIPYQASAVHGITDGMVRGKPKLEAVLPKFFDFLNAADSVVLIHNASFDLGFIRTAALRVGVACPQRNVIDTLGLSRKRLPQLHSHRLDVLVSMFLAMRGADHRAGGDADALRRIFERLVALAPVIGSVADLLAHAKLKRFG